MCNHQSSTYFNLIDDQYVRNEQSVLLWKLDASASFPEAFRRFRKILTTVVSFPEDISISF